MRPTPLALAAWRMTVAAIVCTMTALIVAFALSAPPATDVEPDVAVSPERSADTLG